MAEFRLSSFAEAQIEDILATSETLWGVPARERYATLLITAMQDVAADPATPLVRWQPVRRMRLGLYHLIHSRRNVPGAIGRVAEPRHLLVLRIGQEGIVDILAVVHERMLARRALLRALREGAFEG